MMYESVMSACGRHWLCFVGNIGWILLDADTRVMLMLLLLLLSIAAYAGLNG